MSKVWSIAKREFLVTVTRKGYLFTLFGLPLIMIGGLFAASMLSRETFRDSQANQGPAGVVDRARVLDFRLQAVTEPTVSTDPLPVPGPGVHSRLVAYDDLDKALADLKKGDLSAVFLLETDYLQSGDVVAYAAEKGVFSQLTRTGRRQLSALLRASLASGRLEEEAVARILTPGRFKEMQVSKQGRIQPEGNLLKRVGRFLGPFIMFFLLTMSIFMSSGYLLQGIAEEKQNRVIEILLSSVTPTQLLMGKMMGLGAAGLLQVAFYVVLLVLPASLILTLMTLSPGQILLSLMYVVLGYLLFAGLMAGTGLLGNTSQESQQLSVIWTMTSMIPMFLVASLMQQPHSWLARSFSFFPLTAPVTMLLRLSTDEVPLVDVLISTAVLILGIVLAVKGASRLFRTASLMYGKRPRLGEVYRWLRES
ncbi:MAG: ABC transporter permease [Acidobacteria bacterium]|nr:ABC transporter permease [Acidobacteriota bacterium]